MREILFRGKREDNGELLVSDCIMQFKNYIGRDGFSVQLWAEGEGWVFIIPETVGEFTGLYNGGKQRIFEDDIVRFEGELYRVRREDETPGGYWASTAYILQHIGWDDYMSFVDTIDDFCNEICVEILGNIHDHPELLTAPERIRRRARAKEMTVSTYVRAVVAEDIMNGENEAKPHHPFIDKKFNLPNNNKTE